MRSIEQGVNYGNGVIGPSAKDQIRSNIAHGRELLGLPANPSFFETISRLAKTRGRAGMLAATMFLAACGPGQPFGPKSTPEAAAPLPTATPEASSSPAATGSPRPTDGARITGITDAPKSGDKFVLNHADMDGKTVERNLPQGFTPDSRLVVAPDLSPRPINSNLSVYKDWETVLNTGRPVGDRLAGYNYDYNDFCDNENFRCNVQGDMWAWRVFQGQTVEVPGVGRLEGGPRRSVMVVFINMEPDVVAWDKDELGQVLVKRGFTATGRMFDGSKMPVMEENLVGHWSFRQGSGTPEKSYVGITDHPENANEVLRVTVLYRQWGTNSDGTPRRQFQLYRAEIASVK